MEVGDLVYSFEHESIEIELLDCRTPIEVFHAENRGRRVLGGWVVCVVVWKTPSPHRSWPASTATNQRMNSLIVMNLNNIFRGILGYEMHHCIPDWGIQK